MSSTYAPEGWPTVVPRIFTERPAELVTFIREVFDAVGDFQRERPTELKIGTGVIMVSDTQVRAPTAAFLYVYVPDTDAAHDRAVRAGAKSVEAPHETHYGDRRCMVEDAWGNTWQIATRRG